MKITKYITNQEDLDAVVLLIKKARIVALDTEFTREKTYYPILSIVQVAVKNFFGQRKFFIIDCLSDLDLSEFFAIIANPKIIKILHSATQDLEIFYNESKLLPKSIWDTQIMANFCDFGFNVGYSALVEKIAKKTLDKKQQRSDWQRRPLSSKQIEYAVLDVVFLEKIYKKFLKILKKKSRLSWFKEEMEIFIDKNLFRNDDNLYKNFSFKKNNQLEVFRIKKLVSWRESWAKKNNIPRRHFMKDEDIEKIAKEEDCDFDFTLKMKEEIKKILDCKVENLEKEDDQLSNFMSSKQKILHNKIKELVSKIADKNNLKEQFLITNCDIRKIVCEKKPPSEAIIGWRYDLIGQHLESLVKEPSKGRLLR